MKGPECLFFNTILVFLIKWYRTIAIKTSPKVPIRLWIVASPKSAPIEDIEYFPPGQYPKPVPVKNIKGLSMI